MGMIVKCEKKNETANYVFYTFTVKKRFLGIPYTRRIVAYAFKGFAPYLDFRELKSGAYLRHASEFYASDEARRELLAISSSKREEAPAAPFSCWTISATESMPRVTLKKKSHKKRVPSVKSKTKKAKA